MGQQFQIELLQFCHHIVNIKTVWIRKKCCISYAVTALITSVLINYAFRYVILETINKLELTFVFFYCEYIRK